MILMMHFTTTPIAIAIAIAIAVSVSECERGAGCHFPHTVVNEVSHRSVAYALVAVHRTLPSYLCHQRYCVLTYMLRWLLWLL